MSRRAAKEKLKDARQALYQEHILDAAEQIFAELGYEEAKVVAMAKAAGVSLATVYSTFATKWEIYRAVHARRTAALRAHLSAREAQILRLRYGLDRGGQERTLGEVGQELGISRERVRQLEAEAIRKLRQTVPFQREFKEYAD